MSRQEARKDYPTEVRLKLVEGDIDHFDESFDRFTHSFEERLDKITTRFDERLSKIMWVLVGLLISVSTACIMLAINLGVVS